MIVPKQERRSFLLGLAGLGIGHAMLQSAREVQAAPSQGYVLAEASISFTFAIPVTSSSM